MRRNYFLIAALLIVTTLIGALIFYPDLPSRIPMHWNWRGQVNRYGDKWEIFLMPAAMVIVGLLFAAMPWLLRITNAWSDETNYEFSRINTMAH